ncbi:MAG: 23S rRNA (adenine(2503)-C(2))-methyltransferase RlmN [Bacteriovoracaceae bacterium]|nr:23S rRNA (adenine(2503)-C(2))-methyltransferase RlmN [Bacteriovoracaceae bacterium]
MGDLSINSLPSLYSLTLPEMKELLVEAGFKGFNATQIFNWIYKNHVYEPTLWTNVSKKVKEYLLQNYDFNLPKVVWHGKSKDGTRKFLVAMGDQKTVECVAILAESGRMTLCVSSQVGCAIGCTFCHTGTMGLTRHLSAGEIIGQFLATTKWVRENDDSEFKYTNVVFMGQGEPLHNYDNVKNATLNLLEDNGIGMGQRKVTLSTSGLVPQIEKLWDFPPVNIAISLHAAHNNVRTELMPINKAYDLDRLFSAIQKIPLKAHRRITYEYILIDDLNDRPEDIEGLVKLLNIKESKINLIPFNEYPESRFKSPSKAKVKWFKDELLKRGYVTTVRVTKGDDILAACGQLKSLEEKINLWD